MMLTYAAIRAAAPSHLVLYRVGEFYEVLGDGAATVSRLLGIQLTRKHQKDAAGIPMCGILAGSADAAIARLLSAGQKVAVSEQPVETEGERPLRLTTPGMSVDTDVLAPGRPNNLVVAHAEGQTVAFAWTDLSTGEAGTCMGFLDGCGAALPRITPAEILVSQWPDGSEALALAVRGSGAKSSDLSGGAPSSAEAEAILAQAYGPGWREALRGSSPSELTAHAALLAYVRGVIGSLPIGLAPPRRASVGDTMEIDGPTFRGLEVLTSSSGRDGSLLGVMDRIVTAAGARLLVRQLSAPLTQPQTIARRLAMVRCLVEAPRLHADCRDPLGGLPDILRACGRLSLGESRPTRPCRRPRRHRPGRDYGQAVCVAWRAAGRAGDGRTRCGGRERGRVRRAGRNAAACARLRSADVRPGARVHHDRLRQAAGRVPLRGGPCEGGHGCATGAPLRGDRRQVAQGPHQLDHRLPRRGVVLGREGARPGFTLRQGLASSARFTTPELDALAAALDEATTQAGIAEQAVFRELSEAVLASREALTRIAHSAAALDLVCGLAQAAAESLWSEPEIADDGSLDIERGRHPVAEMLLGEEGRAFVANDCRMSGTDRLWLLTGPNMAGKSTFLRQVAIIVLMAQVGSFVPAARARIGVVDKMFSRIGASDDLAAGRSTFMVEMLETSAILNQATSRSFVILDEVGRGTSTHDGLSIAQACMEYLHDIVGCRTLFATHYHELAEAADAMPHAACIALDAAVGRHGDMFTYRIAPGRAGRSHGLTVAALAGMPGAVLARARELLAGYTGEAPVPELQGRAEKT